jgi:hypothetical protein
MTAPRDTDRLIRAFLEEGRDELPDRAFDAVRARIDQTRQGVVIGPWREEQMSRYAMFALAAAAVVLIAVIGIQFLPRGGGIGSQPTPTATPTAAPTPTASPTAVPTASPTPVADPAGRLTAGTYVAHPFGPPNRAMSFTFSVPSGSWEVHGDAGQTLGLAKYGSSDGLGMGFLRVSSLNGDPCNWLGTADDVAIGPTVDDLVSALPNETEYDTSEPSDVTLGGYSGKQVAVTMPTSPFSSGRPNAPGCDEQVFRIWNAEGFDIYAQGPEHRWTMWILDVEGQRVVVMKGEFANSDVGLSAELQSIVDSIVITAP